MVRKGSRFSFSRAEGFTFLVFLCWRVRIFLHVGGPGNGGFKFSARRPQKKSGVQKWKKIWCSENAFSLLGFILENVIFGRRQHYPFLAALRCQRVQLFSGRFAIIVLGRRRVHDFRPNALEGSLFSSSGAEGFTVFDVMRRRVHVLGARVPKGSRFSLSCAEGFTF